MTQPRFTILGTAGYVPAPERFDDDGLLTVLGANSGNLMFQLAATRLIDGELTHVSPAFTPYADRSALDHARALVFPAANHLRINADWTGLNNYLEGCGKPLVVLGLGAQAAGTGALREIIAALKADAHIARMVAILRERALLITVRGDFTATICDAIGLTGVEALGCPSVFLGPSPGLGEAIARQLADLPDRLRDGSAGAAMTAAAPFEIAANTALLTLERRLFDWTGPDGHYIQQSGGVEAMIAAAGSWHRLSPGSRRGIARILAPDADPATVGQRLLRTGRFFTSAPDWIASMADRGFTLGTRLHGIMAALAAGRPCAIISHDSRTDELAATMHLPRLDLARVLAARDLAAVTESIRFDGGAFDRWRAQAAARLVDAFTRNGIPPSALLKTLASADFIRRTA